MFNGPIPGYDPWSHIPEPPKVGDEYDGNPIITRAVKSIYVFAPGAEYAITRDQAEGVLRWWQHFHELTEREVNAILHRFPAPGDPPLDDAGIARSGDVARTVLFDVPPDSLAQVEKDLRAMGATDLNSAAGLLTSYRHLHALSADELSSVLSRFEEKA